MSDSELDPHVLISCRAAENPKIVDLPSDRARWGWVVLMGKAKLQRPPGQFASERVVAAVLAEHRRYIADYIRVGILEAVETLCADCAQVIPHDDRTPGRLVIHDWTANQSRTQKWRRRVGLTSGHESLSGNQSEDDGETSGETVGKQPRAEARATQSQSHRDTTNVEETTEGGPGGTRDAAVALHERTGSYPSPKVLSWLDEMCEAHGEARLVDAIDRTPTVRRNLRDYLFAVRDALRAADHAADRAERGAEKVRAAEIRRANLPLLVARHNSGLHQSAADGMCPSCRESSALSAQHGATA